MRLSPSLAITIENCTLRARWQRIDKAEPATPEADIGLRYGKTIHRALELIYTDVRSTFSIHPQPLHTPTMLNRAAKLLDNALEEHGPLPDNLHVKARGEILDYLLDQHAVTRDQVLATEGFINWPLRPGTNVVGYIDRIDRRGNSVVAIDYKSGRKRWTSDSIRAELQMPTYVIAVAKRYPWAEQIVAEIAMTGHRETASAMWPRNDIPALEQALTTRYLAADNLLTEGPWTPTVGDWCGSCPFKTWCPAHGGTPQPGTWNPQLEQPQPETDDPTLLDT